MLIYAVSWLGSLLQRVVSIVIPMEFIEVFFKNELTTAVVSLVTQVMLEKKLGFPIFVPLTAFAA